MTLLYCQISFNYVTALSKYLYNISNILHFSCQFTVMQFLRLCSRNEVSKPYNVLLLGMDYSLKKVLELHCKIKNYLATSDAICCSIMQIIKMNNKNSQ